MKLSNRELATVLAALRYWQTGLETAEDGDGKPIKAYPMAYEVATDNGEHEALTVEEIDDLCERINTVADGPRVATQGARK